MASESETPPKNEEDIEFLPIEEQVSEAPSLDMLPAAGAEIEVVGVLEAVELGGPITLDSDSQGLEPLSMLEPEGEINLHSNASSENFQDLTQFAQSAESAGREGFLLYSLMIRGIDTASMRQTLREALTDKKFVWDVNELMNSIKNGELQITKINPIKASILVGRIKGLPLEIEWEQHAIHQI